MSANLPLIYLARHGETAWSLSGQHTGFTDIPLTERGERNARRLGKRLLRINFAHVLTSPLQRARRTCDLAGFGDMAELEPDLTEWNYGEYEGRKTVDIRLERPDWHLFRDGCPGGESVAEISARADRLITRLRSLPGNVLLFSSGHISRVIGARWCGLDAAAGQRLYLGTAAMSALGYEHTTTEPVLRLWNDCWHVGD